MAIGTEEGDDGTEGGDPASLLDALVVYAEPLASGAHAIVIGDAESSIADRLLDLGARGVHVFDPDPARAANAARSAPRGVSVRALVGELDVLIDAIGMLEGVEKTNTSIIMSTKLMR